MPVRRGGAEANQGVVPADNSGPRPMLICNGGTSRGDGRFADPLPTKNHDNQDALRRGQRGRMASNALGARRNSASLSTRVEGGWPRGRCFGALIAARS